MFNNVRAKNDARVVVIQQTKPKPNTSQYCNLIDLIRLYTHTNHTYIYMCIHSYIHMKTSKEREEKIPPYKLQSIIIHAFTYIGGVCMCAVVKDNMFDNE